MKYVMFALVVVLVLVVATLSVQNPTPVNVHFLQFQSGDVPLAVIMLGSTLIGMLLSGVLGVPGRLQRRREARRLRHQLVTTEQQGAAVQDRVLPSVM